MFSRYLHAFSTSAAECCGLYSAAELTTLKHVAHLIVMAAAGTPETLLHAKARDDAKARKIGTSAFRGVCLLIMPVTLWDLTACLHSTIMQSVG